MSARFDDNYGKAGPLLPLNPTELAAYYRLHLFLINGILKSDFGFDFDNKHRPCAEPLLEIEQHLDSLGEGVEDSLLAAFRNQIGLLLFHRVVFHRKMARIADAFINVEA